MRILLNRLPGWVKVFGHYLLALRFIRSWRDIRDFMWVTRQVGPYTMVVPSSLAVLYRLAKEVNRRGIEGDLVECGTWNGGSAAVIAFSHNQNGEENRHLWIFDSFKGLPSTTEEDGAVPQAHIGSLVGDPTKVRAILKHIGMPGERIHIAPGWFHETLPSAPIDSIALLHIDADWYESVKICLERFYDVVSAGGFIVINDYGTWDGARRAVDEFLKGRQVTVPLTWVDPGTRYFEKPRGR